MQPYVPTDLSTDPLAKPQPITEEQWWDALECLPPMDWRKDAGAEAFAVPEPHDYDPQGRLIYWRYVRIGAQHWKMLALIHTPIEELARRCKEAQRNGQDG